MYSVPRPADPRDYAQIDLCPADSVMVIARPPGSGRESSGAIGDLSLLHSDLTVPQYTSQPALVGCLRLRWRSRRSAELSWTAAAGTWPSCEARFPSVPPFPLPGPQLTLARTERAWLTGPPSTFFFSYLYILQVLAKGHSTLGQSPFTRPSAVQVPIAWAESDIIINPGDVIVADADGVVVFRPEMIERVLESVEKGREVDARCMADIAKGRPVAETFAEHRGKK